MQLRVALSGEDFSSLVDFYSAGLGLAPVEQWVHGDGHGILLQMGRGSLELFDEGYADFVDSVEVGERTSGHVRIALQVPDVAAAVERLLSNGATLIRAPVLTPWGDLNARVQAPDGLQVTLFESTSDSEVSDCTDVTQ